MENPWKKHSNINPQREEGNRQIENGVFRAIMKADLTASEYKVFLAVVEKTWGFNKSEDAISRTQFEVMTGLGRRMVKYAIDRMVARRIIIREASTVRVQRGSPVNLYMLNKHYDTWVEQGCTRLHWCNPVSFKGAIQCHLRVQPVAPTKETTKETTKESGKRKKTDLTVTDEWVKTLFGRPAYENKNIWVELDKANGWIEDRPGRKMTRPFFRNWLNKADDDPSMIYDPSKDPYGDGRLSPEVIASIRRDEEEIQAKEKAERERKNGGDTQKP